MDRLKGAWVRLRAIFLRGSVEREVDDELRHHLEMEARHNLSRGMSASEARRQAAISFGGLEKHREEVRDRWRVPILEDVGRDFAYAVRSLSRNPGFAVVAVLTLALGISATSSIYTVVKRVLLDPLPYPEADRLVRLKNQVPGIEVGQEWNMASVQYFFLGDEASSFEMIGAYNRGEANLLTPEGPSRAAASIISASVLEMLGGHTVLGRSILSSDDRPGAPVVALLSEGLWRERFGSDPGAIGRTLEVNGISAEVVGVLSNDTEMPEEPGSGLIAPTDIWLPLAAIDDRFDRQRAFQNNHTTPMIAKLRPGVDVSVAQAELDRLTSSLSERFPTVYKANFMEESRFRPVVHPLKQYVLGTVGRSLWLVLGSVAVVLLIACANVANLILVRMEGRQRELAVHSALGAKTPDIARRFFVDSIVLTGAAMLVSIPFTLIATRALLALAPENLPRFGDVEFDASTLLFMVGVSGVIAATLALFALLRVRMSAPAAFLREEARGATITAARQRTRSILVIGQIALALVLTVAGAFLAESFQRIRAIGPGFDPDGSVAAAIHLPVDEQYRNIEDQWALYRSVLSELEGAGGITAAGMASALPLTGAYGCTGQAFEDPRVRERLTAADMSACADQVVITPGYMEAMRIPVLSGRTLTLADAENPEGGVVLVSKAFADRFWPGEDPI